jgi:hypothetical protein
MLNISLAHNWLSTTTLIMSLSSRLVQACPNVDAPLAQLPGIDVETAAQAGRADSKLREHGWQRYLSGMDEEERRELLKVDEFTEESKAALRRIELLEVSNVSFKGGFRSRVGLASITNNVPIIRQSTANETSLQGHSSTSSTMSASLTRPYLSRNPLPLLRPLTGSSLFSRTAKRLAMRTARRTVKRQKRRRPPCWVCRVQTRSPRRRR